MVHGEMVLALHANKPKIDGELIAFRISNGALTAKELPKRLKLLNWGKNETTKGPVTVGPDTVAQMSINQAKLGYDRIALDFNHQTVEGSEEYEKIIKQRGSIDPIPVAAYGTAQVIPGDGLYLDDMEWTPDGEKYAPSYHDLSPAPVRNKKSEVIFLHSVALCRQGSVKDLSFYNTSFLKPTTLSSSSSMENTDNPNAPDYKALLISLLKKLGATVADGASDSDIAGAVDKYKAPASSASTTDDDDKVTPMTAGEKALLARLEKLENERGEGERAGLLTLAASQGKVIPLSADAIKLVPVSALKELVDKLPAGTVPLNTTRGGGGQPELVVLSADEKTLIKNLGIDEKDYIEQKKAEGATRTAVV